VVPIVCAAEFLFMADQWTITMVRN